MAEPRPTHGALQVHIDYLFDRLHDTKLAQALRYSCARSGAPRRQQCEGVRS
jgi:hypothetical protein